MQMPQGYVPSASGTSTALPGGETKEDEPVVVDKEDLVLHDVLIAGTHPRTIIDLEKYARLASYMQ